MTKHPDIATKSDEQIGQWIKNHEEKGATDSPLYFALLEERARRGGQVLKPEVSLTHDAKKMLMIAKGKCWMETPSRREPGLRECNVFTSNGARFISPRPIDLFVGLVSLQDSDSDSVCEGLGCLGFPSDVFRDAEIVNIPDP